jgi:TatD DNase family protein
MNLIPYIDIHTHSSRAETDSITVQNIYPGEGFAAFSGRNFYSVGLHPWHISTPKENNDALQMVEDALELDHTIFVGEAGLDKLSDNDFKEQMRVFEAQAYMAEEYHYPLIIHCVKAYNEIMEVNKRMNPAMPWIFHGYNGSTELTKQLAKKNVLFSFGINLFNKNSKAVHSIRYLPFEKILFETDEFDGGVDQIYRQAASLKGTYVEFLKKEVWDTFSRIEKSALSRF